MNDSKNELSNNTIADLWDLLFGIIYFLILFIIATIGYYLLEKDIHKYLNQKEYTKEELEVIDKKAMAQLSLEKEEKNWDRISNGIHLRTGLHDDPHLKLIITSCTSCHSAKLITQNKATRAGWKSMINWMQKTQGLPDLGRSEPKILDYLSKYYAPQNIGRRKSLDIDKIKWYVLEIVE